MDRIDEWVCAEFENLAQVIYEYDENLRFEMVPLNQQQHLTDKSKVFRVIDTRTNAVVLYADSLSRPDEILARLWSMDTKHGDVLRRLDAQNAAKEALRLSKELDEREAMKDFSAFVLKNTKSRWSHEGKIYDDEFRELGPKQTVID